MARLAEQHPVLQVGAAVVASPPLDVMGFRHSGRQPAERASAVPFGQGKTLVGLALAAEAARAGRRSAFFSLEYTPADVVERLRVLGFESTELEVFFDLDCSDAISAGYVGTALASAPFGTLAVIDYLQLLDQRRDTPELSRQVRDLKAMARERGLIIVLLSQVDRSYDPAAKPFPDITDIRLPNPVDLRLFDKRCFLTGGDIRAETAA